MNQIRTLGLIGEIRSLGKQYCSKVRSFRDMCGRFLICVQHRLHMDKAAFTGTTMNLCLQDHRINSYHKDKPDAV